MNATELQDALLNAIEAIADARDEVAGDNDDIALADLLRDMVDEFEGVASARSYHRELMLTSDAGLVLRTADGAEFQVTIVQSRQGRGE